MALLCARIILWSQRRRKTRGRDGVELELELELDVEVDPESCDFDMARPNGNRSMNSVAVHVDTSENQMEWLHTTIRSVGFINSIGLAHKEKSARRTVYKF